MIVLSRSSLVRSRPRPAGAVPRWRRASCNAAGSNQTSDILPRLQAVFATRVALRAMTINLGTLVWVRRALLVRFYAVTTYIRYEAKYTISRTLSQPQGGPSAWKKTERAAAYYAGFVAVN